MIEELSDHIRRSRSLLEEIERPTESLVCEGIFYTMLYGRKPTWPKVARAITSLDRSASMDDADERIKEAILAKSVAARFDDTVPMTGPRRQHAEEPTLTSSRLPPHLRAQVSVPRTPPVDMANRWGALAPLFEAEAILFPADIRDWWRVTLRYLVNVCETLDASGSRKVDPYTRKLFEVVGPHLDAIFASNQLPTYFPSEDPNGNLP